MAQNGRGRKKRKLLGSDVAKPAADSESHGVDQPRRTSTVVNKNTVKSLAQQGQAAIGDDVQLMDLEELEAFANNFKKQRIKHGNCLHAYSYPRCQMVLVFQASRRAT